MRRILPALVMLCLVLATTGSVYADGTEEVQPPAPPEAAAPMPMPAPSLSPGPMPMPGAWGRCPFCGSTDRADRELAVWTEVTGVSAEELKACLLEGMEFDEICGAVAIARKQGKTFAEVVEKAKADKVSMRTLAYAAGITMDQLAAEIQALHTAFFERAAAAGLIGKEQVGRMRRALAQGGPGRRMLQAYEAPYGVIVVFWPNMMFGIAGDPGPAE